MAEKCFDQLLGARSTQKLVEIHNRQDIVKIRNQSPNQKSYV